MITGWLEILGLDVRQTFIDAGGVRTRVLEAGSGPALVLLHGTGGHADVYLRNLRGLSPHFRVIAYDLLGHGFTEKPGGLYTPDRYAAHLQDLLDALGIERAHLSGSSLGAWVAAWFAAHYPNRAGGVVLNAPGNIRNNPEGMDLIRESSLRAVREATRDSVRERLNWIFFRQDLLTDELAEIRYRIYTQPGFQKAMEDILCLQIPEVRAKYTWDPTWLGRITSPALVLWNGHDPFGTLDDGRALTGWIPGATIEVIENSGHLAQWEAPDEFNAIHQRFLARP